MQVATLHEVLHRAVAHSAAHISGHDAHPFFLHEDHPDYVQPKLFAQLSDVLRGDVERSGYPRMPTWVGRDTRQKKIITRSPIEIEPTESDLRAFAKKFAMKTEADVQAFLYKNMRSWVSTVVETEDKKRFNSWMGIFESIVFRLNGKLQGNNKIDITQIQSDLENIDRPRVGKWETLQISLKMGSAQEFIDSLSSVTFSKASKRKDMLDWDELIKHKLFAMLQTNASSSADVDMRDVFTGILCAFDIEWRNSKGKECSTETKTCYPLSKESNFDWCKTISKPDVFPRVESDMVGLFLELDYLWEEPEEPDDQHVKKPDYTYEDFASELDEGTKKQLNVIVQTKNTHSEEMMEKGEFETRTYFDADNVCLKIINFLIVPSLMAFVQKWNIQRGNLEQMRESYTDALKEAGQCSTEGLCVTEDLNQLDEYGEIKGLSLELQITFDVLRWCAGATNGPQLYLNGSAARKWIKSYDEPADVPNVTTDVDIMVKPVDRKEMNAFFERYNESNYTHYRAGVPIAVHVRWVPHMLIENGHALPLLSYAHAKMMSLDGDGSIYMHTKSTGNKKIIDLSVLHDNISRKETIEKMMEDVNKLGRKEGDLIEDDQIKETIDLALGYLYNTGTCTKINILSLEFQRIPEEERIKGDLTGLKAWQRQKELADEGKLLCVDLSETPHQIRFAHKGEYFNEMANEWWDPKGFKYTANLVPRDYYDKEAINAINERMHNLCDENDELDDLAALLERKNQNILSYPPDEEMYSNEE